MSGSGANPPPPPLPRDGDGAEDSSAPGRRRQEGDQRQQQQQQPPELSLSAAFESKSEAFNELYNEALRIDEKVRVIQMTESGELEHPLLDLDNIVGLAVTKVNGSVDLPGQGASVAYIRGDQRLVIPTALALKPHAGITVEDYVRPCSELVNSFWKMARRTYADIKYLTDTHNTFPELCSVVMRMPAIAAEHRVLANIPPWHTDEWCRDADGLVDARSYVTFTFVSKALKFNCDLRDLGFLFQEDATMADEFWQGWNDIPEARLDCKLEPFTLQSIAALNMPAVRKVPVAAWTRAHGLAAGVLPNRQSLIQPEYIFSRAQPIKEHSDAVRVYESTFYKHLRFVCLNVLAVFGLLHLNKDHTYVTGDQDMERNGKSYIETLRTYCTKEQIESFVANMEDVIRTGPHPFGLGQTYAVARILWNHKKLTSPLHIRIDTLPPPVQRLSICDAAAQEWSSLPVGQTLSNLYSAELTLIRRKLAEIRRDPPRYSALHRHYGHQEMAEVDLVTAGAIKAMMPCAYGYIMNTHAYSDSSRDGLGYAKSLRNLERDQKGLIGVWQGAWDKQITNIDSTTLIKFAMQIIQQRRQQAAQEQEAEGAAGA